MELLPQIGPEALVAVGALALGGVAYLWALRETRVRDAWTEAASALGLEQEHAGASAMHGVLRGFEVSVRGGTGESAPGFTRVDVKGGERIPRDVALRFETGVDALKKLVGLDDLRCGDDWLDQHVHIEGSEAAALAMLNHAARRAMRKLVRHGEVVVRDGSVSCDERGVVDDDAQLVELVSSLAELAKRLSLPRGGIPAALARNAKDDPLPEVRLRNLEALAKHYRDDPNTARAARKALQDPHTPARLLAATLVGGAPAFDVLARTVRDRRRRPDQRVAALRQAVRTFPDRARDLVASAFDEFEEPLVLEAIRSVGTLRAASLLQEVCGVAVNSTPAVAEASAQALRLLADPAAEPTLIQLLKSASKEVRRTAAEALGSAGTLRCVEALLPLTRSLLEADDVKNAAADAIRRVQARVGDAGAGRLSLSPSDGPAGAVSLSAATGELSIAPPDARDGSSGAAPSPGKVR